ncbi:DUF4266 domain-containing protein [Ramlibacter sp.]|uniref:DUF4266 domain-containing protein n=1 Tax=Ramlibacter sp. TaxID=1917967 RepID=UPI002FC5927E
MRSSGHLGALSRWVVPACALLAGCSGLAPVQPWEKGVLARPSMTFDADRLDSAYVEHTYSSKEGASGGAGVGGGGCGCN